MGKQQNMRSLKIVFISDHACGRAIKQAVVLYRKGYDVTLVSSNIPKGRGGFTRKINYDSPDELCHVLDLFNDKSIFHVHNEPSWMVTLIREKYPKARIVFDVHDSNYWRTTEDWHWYEEDTAAALCDAYVFPSSSAKKQFPKHKKPAIVIPSANPMEYFHYGGWDYYGGIVSEGGHIIPSPDKAGELWRDYTDIYKQLVRFTDVFVYSAEFLSGSIAQVWRLLVRWRKEAEESGDVSLKLMVRKLEYHLGMDTKTQLTKYYWDLGVHAVSVSHGALLDRVGQHDWGLCGNLNSAPVWNVALPNKFFDYVAGGVPVANFNCPEVAKLIDRHGCGINVQSTDELKSRWGRYKDARTRLFLARHNLAMERFIPRLEKLYGSL